MIDTGSAITIIDTRLAKDLQLQGEKSPLTIEWADCTRKTIEDSRRVMVKIQVNEHQQYTAIMRTMDVTLPSQEISRMDLQQAGIVSDDRFIPYGRQEYC